jgi:chromosome segregation ATPase
VTVIESRINVFGGEMDEKDRTINRLNQEVSMLQQETTKIYEL